MNNYGIREGYKPRPEPDYFQDVRADGLTWQPDILPIAAYLARLMKRHTLIDVGCGRAYNLVNYAPEFKIIGIDHGDNLRYCRDHYPEHAWIDMDLEWETGLIPNGFSHDAVIVCADVAEHLSNPSALLALLKLNVRYAPIVFSTPDRLRTYGYDHLGMPDNKAHAREWRLDEMTTLLKAHNIPVAWAGYTASENRTRVKNTMLLMLGLDAPYAQAIEQTFDVEVAR